MFGLNALDFIAIFLVIASAANGVRKGFTAEAMKLLAWAGAIFITIVARPAAGALFSSFITLDILAEIVGMAVVFVATLIALNFLGKFIGERIRTSFMGPLDRGLGGLFGVLRGVIVISAAFLIFTLLVAKKDYPDWVLQARLLPYMEIGAIVIAEITPDLFEDTFGYGEETREGMDDLVGDVADDG